MLQLSGAWLCGLYSVPQGADLSRLRSSGPVWIDREAQFAADAEEESHRGEAIFDAAAGHCNERVWCVGGEDAGEEVEVFVLMFKDVVV